ncbi:Eukaryotic peptide chain release factor subunit 1-2 [Zea mays]|uniref:Eukaryotic peptide chain release factor subunit 1-2 n=1 Tax=Zea mays TaxID=4577 RepID=A0A1D6I8K5_MAIZE|nr:Eukaryotic peptide chain release factor subunit 1-2 [Zea mays]
MTISLITTPKRTISLMNQGQATNTYILDQQIHYSGSTMMQTMMQKFYTKLKEKRKALEEEKLQAEAKKWCFKIPRTQDCVTIYESWRTTVGEWRDPWTQTQRRKGESLLNVVDVSYGGENLFNQAIELSAEILANVKFIQVKKLIGKNFEEISQDTGKYVFGVDDTLKALEMGAVETW